MIDFVKDSDFDFWLPLTLAKSNNAEKIKGHSRWIQGIASTEDYDLQKESVIQHGIDFSYFLKHGYYNDDHKKGPKHKVGQPTETKVTNKGLWTKGYLWEPGTHETSDAIWELIHALVASNSDRKVGFSIQGKTVHRAGNRILKCWVQDIAITVAPINTHTWLDVVKSLDAVPEDKWCKGESDLWMEEDLLKKAHKCTCKTKCHDCTKSIDSDQNSSLDEDDMDLKKKKEKEEEEKALSTQSGSAIIPESLDSKEKKQGLIGKSLSEDECIFWLQRERGLSKSQSQVIVNAIFEINNH